LVGITIDIWLRRRHTLVAVVPRVESLLPLLGSATTLFQFVFAALALQAIRNKILQFLLLFRQPVRLLIANGLIQEIVDLRNVGRIVILIDAFVC
jgi:hypothetical protein